MEMFLKDFNGCGPLYTDEILVYYEMPQLFTLFDNCKNLYISLLINIDLSKYIIVNISKERLNDIKDSSISLRDVFINPEMNKVYILQNDVVSEILPSKLSENDLPDEHLFLKMLINPEMLVEEKEKQWDMVRDSLSIRLINTFDPKEHEIDCNLFAKIISTIQKLVTAQARCKYSKQYKATDIIEMSKLNFSSSFIGSVGVKFKTKERQNLLNETKLTPILESLAQLLEGCSIEKIKAYFDNSNYDYKVISCYKNYLNTLLKNDFDIEYNIRTNQKTFKYYIDNSNIKEQYINLNKYISNKTFNEDFEGILVAADTKNKTFKLETDDRIINGTIPKQLLKENYRVNNNVIFRLEVKQEKQSIGGKLIEKFKLLEIIKQE